VRYLLDTNIVIHAHDGTESVLSKLAEHDGEVAISTLSLVELARGIHRGAELALARRQKLDLLLSAIPKLPFDVAAAQAYDQIIERCGFARNRDYDRMIAAHAISANAILVTDNESDFTDIPGLTLENWSA